MKLAGTQKRRRNFFSGCTALPSRLSKAVILSISSLVQDTLPITAHNNHFSSHVMSALWTSSLEVVIVFVVFRFFA